jgi:hypothetical protein
VLTNLRLFLLCLNTSKHYFNCIHDPGDLLLVSLVFMARSQLPDGEEGLQMWSVVANVLTKQSQIADKGWSTQAPPWRVVGQLYVHV